MNQCEHCAKADQEALDRAIARMRDDVPEHRFDLQQLLEDALTTDGAHHKQWYLHRIAEHMNILIRVDHEPGIAP